MQKAISLSRTISNDLNKNYIQDLTDQNLYVTFSSIYNNTDLSIEERNAIVCFIIFSYDNDSKWLNLKQDRYDNKIRIFKSLNIDPDIEFFRQICLNENDTVNAIISNYVIEQLDWRWQTIFSLLDYHSKMIRYSNTNTESYKKWDDLDNAGAKITLTEDIDQIVISKINKEKGDILEKAIDARKKADELLSEIKKEYTALDTAVEKDFGFSITEEKKIVDITSWTEFIINRNEKRISLQ